MPGKYEAVHNARSALVARTQGGDDGDSNITGVRKSPDSLYHRRQFPLRRSPSILSYHTCGGRLRNRLLLPLLSLLALLLLLLL